MNVESITALIQRQFDAYNAKDIDGWLSTYAANSKQYNLHGECIAEGHEQMRKNITVRFEEPDLHARLISRTVTGNIVVDQELITRNFPDGKGTIEMLCIYEVSEGLIQKASFAFGAKTLTR